MGWHLVIDGNIKGNYRIAPTEDTDDVVRRVTDALSSGTAAAVKVAMADTIDAFGTVVVSGRNVVQVAVLEDPDPDR